MTRKTGAPVRSRMTKAAKQSEDNPVSAGSQHTRLSMAHALLIITFPVLGCVLHLAGHIGIYAILQLLGACGGIGAAVLLLVTSGRRIANTAGAAAGRAIRAALTNQA
jgi:hypothetical protein